MRIFDQDIDFTGFFMILRILLVVLLGFYNVCFAARPFIIDTDVSSDDEVAIYYLLNRSDIEIKGITIAAAGETHCAAGLQNVNYVLQLMQQKIPVACGRAIPLKGQHHFPAAVRKTADQLIGISQPVNMSISAEKLFQKIFAATTNPIDILAIGPLTNVAAAIQSNPDAKKKIHMIYIMGGAVHVPGNVGVVEPRIKNSVAEWNFYVDPYAADIVFRSGIPITLVSLDVTNQMPLTIDFYESIKNHQDTKAKQFFYKLFSRNEAEIKAKWWYFWDPLAAVIASDDSVANMQTEKLRVVLSPEIQSGATVVDEKHGNNVRVCRSVKNKRQIETMLLS